MLGKLFGRHEPDELVIRALEPAAIEEGDRRRSEAAKALINVGESARPENLDASELAAWTAIANILLNLDETITKG